MTLQPNHSFGDCLRRFRERAGITQATLAEKAGLTAKAISALERGDRRQPYPHTIQALSNALGLAPQERAELLAARYGNRATSAPSDIPIPAEIPPPPVTSQQHNLPAEVSSFVGRQTEIADVKQLLRTRRLVTMTGAGGSGKTRLALAVANEVAADYPDGVWLVQLADLTEGALVPDAIARALNLHAEAGIDITTTIVEALRPRTMLLILDNCEHLIEMSAKIVERLLVQCPKLTICVTSREVLRVGGECVYLVPTLPAPHPDLVLQYDQIQSYDAVHLFLERAVAHQPNFSLDEMNARAVADICWRLDGIPLAIELAAARIRSMAPQQVVERLHNSLGLLTGGSRTALPRQQTLRGALDWSYALLNVTHRRLFRQMSVFVGGWELDAAEVVGASYEADSAPVADALDRLVEQSLLVVEGSNNSRPRYRMLEPVRQYAMQLLEESGEALEARRRHAAVYLLLAERAHRDLRREPQVEWLRTIGREHENLRAALVWSLRSNEHETAARIGWALWPFWWIRNYHREGRRWTEAVRAHKAELPSLLFRRITMAALAMAYGQADDQTAEQFMNELMRLSEDCGGDPHAEAYAYSGFGLVALNRGQLAAALEHLETARRLLEQSGEAGMAAQAHTWIGTALLLSGQYEAAHARFTMGLSGGRAIGDRLAMTNALFNLAQMALATGNYQDASTWLCQGIPLSQEMDDRGNIAFILEGLAIVAAANAQDQRSACLFGAAEHIIERLGLRGHTYYQPDRSLQDQSITTLRERLGEEGFARARATGWAMGFEEAVKYALKQLP